MKCKGCRALESSKTRDKREESARRESGVLSNIVAVAGRRDSSGRRDGRGIQRGGSEENRTGRACLLSGYSELGLQAAGEEASRVKSSAFIILTPPNIQGYLHCIPDA